METSRSLLSALKHWAALQPDKTLHTFVDDRGAEVERLTYRQLLERSTNLAAKLLDPASHGMRSGDRALLVFPPCLDFIVAFYACLLAGVVAVPVFPPDPRGKGGKEVALFAAVVRTSGASIALTSKSYNLANKLGGLKRLFTGSDTSSGSGQNGLGAWPEHLKWMVVDEMAQGEKVHSSTRETFPTSTREALQAVAEADASGVNRAQPAFLQFTSGSTSEPKGVIISHGNLAHNLSLIIEGLRASDDTVVVSWLPLYHDMGLIGSYLGALYCGGSGVYLSPLSFIRHPPLWLELISKHKGTHMQAPNFAYGLAARKFLALPGRDRRRLEATLDLSSVRHMINAAEPVRQADMELFKATFERHGLPTKDGGVIFPTYGLAEHTVFVCTNGSQVLTLNRQQLEVHGKVVLVDSSSSASPASASAVQARKQQLQGDADVDEGNSATATVTAVGCGYPGQAKGVDLRIVQHASVGTSSTSTNDVVVVEETESASSPSSLGVEVEGEDWVGEIWVKSASRAEGYWSDEAKTAQDFGGQLRGGPDKSSSSSTGTKEGYLRTGDLGFLHNGELFVCGRVKDLIICNGANLYPQDIERAAEDSCSMLRGGCSAAFSLPPPTTRKKGTSASSSSSRSTAIQEGEVQEALFLVAEVTDAATKDLTLSDFAATIASLRASVSSSTGAALDGIFLLAPRTVPKTTSGKIARQWCKRGLKEGTLEVIYEWFDYSRFNGTKSNNNHDAIPSPFPESIGSEMEQASRDSKNGGDDRTDGGASSNSGGGNSAWEMSEEEVLEVIVEAVAVTVLRVEPSSIDAHAPVPSLGLGSMEGVQVLNILERRFGVSLPNEILFEEETTLARLVPLIRAGGGVGLRACLVDAAQIAAKEVAGQTEEQRISKLRTATVKSSWRDNSLPVDCLCPKAATSANAAAASALVNEAFRDAVVSNAWRLAFFLIGGGAAGLGVRALTGRSSPLLSSSSSSSPTIITAEHMANQGGEDASTSVGAMGLAPLWVLLVVVGGLVALAASLAARRMQRFLQKGSSNDRAFFGSTSARAQVCAYLGSKVLYEAPLDPLDGPYLVCAFPPAPVLAASSPSAASAALNLTQTSQSSAAALEVLTTRAAQNANKERAEYRASAAQQVASEVTRFGGLPLAAGGPPHESALADAAALAEQNSSGGSGGGGGASQLGSVSGCAAVVGLFPRSGNGSVALLGAAAVQGGVFGPMGSADDNKEGSAVPEVSLLRSPVDLACLSGTLPPGGSLSSMTSDAAAIFKAAAAAPPPLAIVALAPLLGLAVPKAGATTASSGFSKKAAAAGGVGAAKTTTVAAEAAANVLKRGGTVFYGATISASGHGAVKAALAPAVTRDAGVMAAAAVARDVGAACAVAVRAAMRHGAALVPCLVLGDDDVNALLFQDSGLGWATGFTGEKARSAAHAVQGDAAPSMLGAAALALSSLVTGNSNKNSKQGASPGSKISGGGQQQQPLSTCAVYGRPISVPHTSSPHPKVVAAYAAEYLTALAALEEKYAHLHPSH